MSLSIARGSIWEVRVPFREDVTQSKLRPAAVIGWSKPDGKIDPSILFIPISAFGGGSKPLVGDLEITDFKSCGLKKLSYLRTHRLISLDPRVIYGNTHLGILDSSLVIQALYEIEKLFSVPFLEII